MALADLSERHKLIVTGAAAAVLVVGLGALVFFLYSKNSDLLKKIESKRNELQGYRDKFEKSNQVSAKLKDTKEKTKQYIALLPEEGEIERLIRKMGETINETGVINKSITPGKAGLNPATKLREVEYQMQIEGGFHEFVRFINRIEDHFDRFLAVNTIAINAEAAGLKPGAKHHTINLRLVTYVYEAAPAAAPAPAKKK